MASVGTLWVDVRFNTEDLSRRLGAGLGAAGAGAGAALSSSLSSRLTSIGASAANAGRQISLGLSLPLIAIGKAAVDAFTGFDKAMTQINALVGVSRETTDAWRGDILKLGSTYAQSAAEMGEAQYFITSSGIEAKDALGVLEIAAKGAAVGLGTTRQVADVVTSAINAYGAENITAARAADVLTVAVREGKAEASQMGGALASIIPLGAALGVSFEELAGSMASMSLSGTTPDEAATQLRGILNTLADMTPQSKQALKAFTGITFETLQADLKSQGLIKTLKKVTDAFKGNEDQMSIVFPNIRAYTGVLNLFGNKEKQTTEIVNKATAAQGDLQRAMDATAESASFKFDKAKTDISNAMTEIGASVLPVFTTLSEKLAGVAQGFTNLPGPVKTGLVAIGSIAAAAGPMLYVYGSSLRLVGMLSGPLAAAWAGLGTQMLGFATTGTGVAKIFGEIGLRAHAAASAMAGPVVVGAAAGIIIYSQLNAKLHENAELFAALAEGGKKNNNESETWDELQTRIAATNAETKKYQDEIDALRAKTEMGEGKVGFGIFNALNLGNTYDINAAREAGEATTAVAEDAARLAGMAGALAAKFGITKDAAVKWAGAQRALHPEIKTSEDAIRAYDKAIRDNDPSVVKAVETTQAATGTFSGLIASVKSTSDAFFGVVNAEKAYTTAQKAIVDARGNVTKAQESYADAVRQTEAAQRRVVEADQRLIKSGKSLADARLDAAEAQNKLNEALAGPSADEKINLDSAKLSVREARAGLRTKPGEVVDPLARQRARIGLRQAQQSLKEAQGAHDEVIAGARKDLASAVDAVTDAEDAQRDAAQGVIEARLAVVDSQRKQAEAFDAIAVAQAGVAQAERDALEPAMAYTQAQSDLNDMIDAGTIKANEFREYLIRLKEIYPELAGVLDPLIEKTGKLVPPPPPPAPEYGGPPRPASDRAPGVNRAHGGPLGANQLSTVNELGVPEMWSQGGRQYLLPLTAGKVTPLVMADIPVKGGDGATAGFSVGDINVYETSGRPRQTAYEVRRELRKESYLSGRRP